MKADVTRSARSRAKRQHGQSALPLGAFDVGPLRDSFQFLRGFVRNPAQVGSVVPSSRWLEQRLVREARDRGSAHRVELGPGTGGTTAAILQAMPAAARLLAIELDPDFHRHLRASLADPRLDPRAWQRRAARRLPGRAPA